MPSQVDLDQGGTIRQLTRIYLGPSVGWVEMPTPGELVIIVAGTYNIVLGTTLIYVNVAGSVTINLPKAAGSAAGAQALPKTFVGLPITVIDQGGNAVAFPITINPGDGTISGLASTTLQANFGALTFNPNTPNAGYTLSQS